MVEHPRVEKLDRKRKHFFYIDLLFLICIDLGFTLLAISFRSDLIYFLIFILHILALILQKKFLDKTIFTKRLKEEKSKSFQENVDLITMKKVQTYYYDSDPFHLKGNFSVLIFFGIILLFISITFPIDSYPIILFFKGILMNLGIFLSTTGIMALLLYHEYYGSKKQFSKETKFFLSHISTVNKAIPKQFRANLKFQIQGRFQYEDVIINKTKLAITNDKWKEHGIESILLQVSITEYLNYPYLVLVHNGNNPELNKLLLSRKLREKTKTNYPIIYEIDINKGYHLLIARLDLPSKSSSVPHIDIYDFTTIIKLVFKNFVLPSIK